MTDTVKIQATLDEIAAQIASESARGATASYIPELARAGLGSFGIAVAYPEAKLIAAGDADFAFSVQSLTNVFTLVIPSALFVSNGTGDVPDATGSSERVLCMASRAIEPPCAGGSSPNRAAEAGLG